MCVISAFTLFPNNVLPVTSSLLMLKESPLEDLEYSMDIGVFHCASYRTENNNPVLKKWFQSQKRQNKKITIIANFLKTEALCAMDPQWRQGR